MSAFDSPISISDMTKREATYDIGCTSRAAPEIADRDLAIAAAVGLSNNVSAIAGWQDLFAIDIGGPIDQLRRRSHGGSGEQGEERYGNELHSEDFVGLVGCVRS